MLAGKIIDPAPTEPPLCLILYHFSAYMIQGHSVANCAPRCWLTQSIYFPALHVFFIIITISMKPKVFSRGNATDALAASMAVPLLFKPVWAHGRPLLDGAVGDVAGVAGIDRAERTLYHHVRISKIRSDRKRFLRID